MIIVSLLFVFMMGYQIYLIKQYKALKRDEMSYVASLTHDLKSPARAQINMLNLLLKGQFGQLNPKQYEMLKLTCSSAKYMSNLVGTVLSGYCYGINSAVLHKTEFDLISLINFVIRQNELIISEKGLNIIFNHDECEQIIFADKLQIQRVIENLFSNAVTYGFENTEIIINLNCEEKEVHFSISNKSYYIEPKELKNIFNKFSKTVNSGLNSASTGIGLFTAKRIITMHGGKIYAQCTPDGICTFGFRLKAISNKTELLKK